MIRLQKQAQALLACYWHHDQLQKLFYDERICNLHQKSKVPHCLLSIFFVPVLCLTSFLPSLSRPRLRPMPSLGKPRFSPSSKTQALHHFCILVTLNIRVHLYHHARYNRLRNLCTTGMRLLTVIYSITHPEVE